MSDGRTVVVLGALVALLVAVAGQPAVTTLVIPVLVGLMANPADRWISSRLGRDGPLIARLREAFKQLSSVRRSSTASQRVVVMTPRVESTVEYNLLVTVTFCLLAAGAVMVYSASSSFGVHRTISGSGYLVRYLASAAVGLVLMFLLARRGSGVVPKFTGPLLALSFVGLIATKLPGVGRDVSGAYRWIHVGALGFQPSELVKLALLLYAARVLTSKRSIVLVPRLMTPLLLICGAATMLVASEPDLGTAVILMATLTCVLTAAGVRQRDLAVGAFVLIGLVVLFALIEPYRRARLEAFMNPWANADTSGFQSVHGQLAIHSGGALGTGLGSSAQDAYFPYEANTDFILAVVGEELGVVGIAALVFLYGLLAYAGLRVAQRARSDYQRVLAAGATGLVLTQCLMNMFGVLGLAPLAGVPLPLLSYGPSSMIVTLAAIGVLLNVARSAGVARTADLIGRRIGFLFALFIVLLGAASIRTVYLAARTPPSVSRPESANPAPGRGRRHRALLKEPRKHGLATWPLAEARVEAAA